MIERSDVVELAPGVALRGDALVDSVRGIEVPVNASARAALRPRTSVEEIAATLERLGAREPLVDARDFVTQLNKLLLANVRLSWRARLGRRACVARYGLLAQAPPRRLDVRPRTFVPALLPTVAAIAAALLPLAYAAGVWPAALAAGVGVALHEAAHALVLHGVPRVLVLDGLKPSVLHAPVKPVRSVVAATAGPLAPALLAVAIATAAHAAAPACVPLAAHSLALTVLTPDGRNACGLS